MSEQQDIYLGVRRREDGRLMLYDRVSGRKVHGLRRVYAYDDFVPDEAQISQFEVITDPRIAPTAAHTPELDE